MSSCGFQAAKPRSAHGSAYARSSTGRDAEARAQSALALSWGRTKTLQAPQLLAETLRKRSALGLPLESALKDAPKMDRESYLIEDYRLGLRRPAGPATSPWRAGQRAATEAWAPAASRRLRRLHLSSHVVCTSHLLTHPFTRCTRHPLVSRPRACIVAKAQATMVSSRGRSFAERRPASGAEVSAHECARACACACAHT